MAEQPAILRGDNGAAVRLALGSLLVFFVIQAAILLLLPSGKRGSDPAAEVQTQPPPSAQTQLPALPLPASPSLNSLPPQPAANPDNAPPPATGPSLVAGLPPPPGQLPARSPRTLPPPPAALGSDPKTPARPSPLPPSPNVGLPTATLASHALHVATPPSSPPAPPPAPVKPAAPVSATGDPEVDAILAEAKETMSLNDPTATRAALEALQRADLRMPEHPLILREMALAYRKLGEASVADSLFERSNRSAPRTAPQTTPAAPFASDTGTAMRAASAPAPSGLDAAFAPVSAAPQAISGPLKLGLHTSKQDLTCTTGEKRILRLELKAAPGSVISPEDINIDVFFYDLVDGQRAELSKCDKPIWDFDLPFDFAQGGVEHINITYHMPKMNEAETREHGLRQYHGYVAKLHYKGKFLDASADPRTLLTAPSDSPGSAPPLKP